MARETKEYNVEHLRDFRWPKEITSISQKFEEPPDVKEYLKKVDFEFKEKKYIVESFRNKVAHPASWLNITTEDALQATEYLLQCVALRKPKMRFFIK